MGALQTKNVCLVKHEHLFKPSGCKPLAWLNLWAKGAYGQPAGSTSYASINISYCKRDAKLISTQNKGQIIL